MEKIAYLGLGIMGQGMAANLLKASYPVTVWNRTPAACEPLVEQGATQANSPAEAVAEQTLEEIEKQLAGLSRTICKGY